MMPVSFASYRTRRMRITVYPRVVAVALLLGPGSVPAQQPQTRSATAPASASGRDTRTQQELRADYDAHHREFDYLLGDWEFTQTRPSNDGAVEFQGFWSATRSADGAIITDEFRIVDDSGRTMYVSTTLRSYSPIERRWNLVGIEPGAGVVHLGTAWKEGSDMRIDQTFGQTIWRIRYHDIQPSRFSWRADISRDGGKTWIENHRTIEARRIGPARAPASLTPPEGRKTVGTRGR
jgi:hypothetical protein